MVTTSKDTLEQLLVTGGDAAYPSSHWVKGRGEPQTGNTHSQLFLQDIKSSRQNELHTFRLREEKMLLKFQNISKHFPNIATVALAAFQSEK